MGGKGEVVVAEACPITGHASQSVPLGKTDVDAQLGGICRVPDDGFQKGLIIWALLYVAAKARDPRAECLPSSTNHSEGDRLP